MTAEIVGRTRELGRLRSMVAKGTRLVTILGPGGCGKTTLARQLHGATFVDLSACKTPAEATRVLQRTVGLPVEERLQALEGVLILDNCEQVEVSLQVSEWLAQGVQIVATSRTPLNLVEEQHLRIEGLDATDAATLLSRRLDDPSDATAEQCTSMLEHLGGLPLAIELAASRVGLLGAAGVVQMLADPLHVLAARGGDRPQRHQSLQRTLAGSWQLLSPSAAALATELALFSGSFDHRDMAWLSSRHWLLDLEELVEASLVRADEGTFSLFVGVREFALQMGDGHGVHAHRRWVLDQAPSERRLGEALTALHRCHEPTDSIALALWCDTVLSRTGPHGLRREVLGKARRTAEAEHHVDLRLAWVRALIDLSELSAAKEELDSLPRPADPAALGRWLQIAVQLATNLEDIPRARALCLEAREHFAVVGDRDGEAHALVRLAILDMMAEQTSEAILWLDAAIDRAPPNSPAYARAMEQKAVWLWDRGETERALESMVGAKAAFARREETHRLATTETCLAWMYLELGAGDNALQCMQRAVDHDEIAEEIRWRSFRRFQRLLVRWLVHNHQDEEELRELLIDMRKRDLMGYRELVCLWASLLTDDRVWARALRDEVRPAVEAHHFREVLLLGLELAESADNGTAQAALTRLEQPDDQGRVAAQRASELRTLAMALRKRVGANARVTIGPGWFTVDQELTDIRTRGALRRILAALAANLDGPAMTLDDVFVAGWPGQKAVPAAARNRVYTAIAGLRKMGLGDTLERQDDGYRLRAADCRVTDREL